MRITINVTEKDIKNGENSSSESCPIAKALRKAGFKGASVFGTQISLFSKRSAFKRGTMAFTGRATVAVNEVPKKVTAFVRNFDSGRKVRPFSFVLNLSLDDIKSLNFKPRLAA